MSRRLSSCRRTGWWIAVGIVASVPILASCSSSSASPTASSARHGTVTGTLRASGGPAPGTPRTAQGEVSAFRDASLTGQPAAKTKTTANGSFSLNLPAGTYYLAATSPSFNTDQPPATPPCRADKPAIVSIGSTIQLDVVCAMK